MLQTLQIGFNPSLVDTSLIKLHFEDIVLHLEHLFKSSSVFIMISLFEMIYITFNLNPLPCMSVRLNILPPVNDFNILFVT